ncbi:PAS domain S-box protein [Oryzomonas japonica]|uniref:histidine kinase n=1 Tax=Oryzomonas japonica TaxID=2603858 RepID=A0A7J4ZRS1_9BACT|nr:PAS domain S-box protein [Oryzomonas japonica]KAB0666016.1 PAS domain S-box protein [Oryzomonas japonica]
MRTLLSTRWSLRVKITVYFLGLTVAVFSSSLLLTIFLIHSQLKLAIADHQNAELAEIAAQVDDRLKLALRQLGRMAAALSPADMGSPDKLQQILDHEDNLREFFDGGFVAVSPDFRLLAESPFIPDRRGVDLSSRDFIRRTVETGQPLVSTPYRQSIGTHDPSIAFTAPIKSRDGTLLGVLIGRHNLLKGSFLQSVVKTTVKGTGYFYIFSKERTMVVHNNPGRIMETIRPGMNVGIDRVLHDGFEGSMDNVNSHGGAGISSFRKLQQADWILASHVSDNEIYTPIRATQGTVISAFVFIALCSVVLVWLVMGRITRPLQMVVNHIGAMSDKRGEERLLPETLNGELGSLAHAFNELIANVDDQQEVLRISHETYRIVAEFTAEVAFWLDPDNQIQYISPNCLELTGYSEGEFHNRRGLVEQIIHPDYLDLWHRHIHEYDEESGKQRQIELKIIAKNGEERWVTHLCHQVYNTQDVLLGTRGNFTDITPLKQLQNRLQEQKEFAENLVGKAAVPLFVLNAQHRIIVWNSAMETLSGLPASEMIGTNRQWEPFYDHERPVLADLILSGEISWVAEFYDRFRDSLHVNQGLQSEGWYENIGNKRRYLFFDAAPVMNSSGEIIATIETVLDITDRKLAEEEQRKLSWAIEENPCSIVITNPLGDIDYVNKKFCELTGYDIAEAIGRNPRILKSGEMPPEVYETLWKTVSSGRTWHGELLNKKKNGELYWELASISPIKDEAGHITHYLAVKEDITQRKQYEQELAKSRAELQQKHTQLSELFVQIDLAKQEWEDTMDCVSDLVLMCDSWGRIRRCNRPVCDLAARDYNRIIGEDCIDLLNEIGMDMSNYDGMSGHLVYKGGQRHFELLSFPLKKQGADEMRGIVVSLHDVTRSLKMSQELEKAYADLKETQMQVFQQEKMASIGQLAAGVAHEINNPMGFISSNLSTLRKYLDKLGAFEAAVLDTVRSCGDEASLAVIADLRKSMKIDFILGDVGSLLDESREGADRVRRIVQDLKSFSRLDEVEYKPADINECLDSTLNMLRSEIKYVADVVRDYGDLPMINCYPQQLNQVFMNILVNAAHAIEGHGEITVRTSLAGDAIRIVISDTGTGIAPEHIKRIFEPFFTTKEVGKGTGLGLSISYDIVKKHGGDISVASEAGRGTTFTIVLPLVNPTVSEGEVVS